MGSVKLFRFHFAQKKIINNKHVNGMSLANSSALHSYQNSFGIAGAHPLFLHSALECRQSDAMRNAINVSKRMIDEWNGCIYGGIHTDRFPCCRRCVSVSVQSTRILWPIQMFN